MSIDPISGEKSGQSAAEGTLYPDFSPAAALTGSNWPLGIFVVDEGKNQVVINQHLAELLGNHLIHSQPLPWGDFIKKLTSRAVSPPLARADFLKARKYLEKSASFFLDLKTRPPQTLEIILSRWESHSSWIGLAIDKTALRATSFRQLEILRDLCRQSRKASAGLGGNLDALAGNFSAWDAPLIGDFLEESRQQLRLVNKQLDLALSFLQIVDRSEVFLENVELEELMEDLIAEHTQQGNHIIRFADPRDSRLAVLVDPILTGLALDYLLKEITLHSPEDQAVEISLAEIEGGVLINLLGSRNLTLPGMSAGTGEFHDDQLSPTFVIAARILSAQGGEVRLQQDGNHPEAGLNIEILLPRVPDPETLKQSRTKSLRERAVEGRILIAEAQPEYQLNLREALTTRGYRVDLAEDGAAALDLVQRINPDAVLLARNLPGMDGLLVTQGIRRWSSVPVLMLSSRTHPEDLVHAFEAGVDDYLAKPFLMAELLLRLEAVLKRSDRSREPFVADVFQSGTIRINYSTRQVWKSGSPLQLTPIEYNLLVYLSRHSKQIMTYEQLLNRVWEGPEKGTRQGLFVHIRRLREKIEADPKNPEILRNKWGVGYVFNP